VNNEDISDEELIELVELTAVTAVHCNNTMLVSGYARQFGLDQGTASKVVEEAGDAHQRACEMRLRRKRGRRPTVVLKPSGGVAGEMLISSHYRIGLNGPKKNGRPWLTVDKAIDILRTRTGRRLKRNHCADNGGNSARGRARAHLKGWLKAHYWLCPYVDKYGFRLPLPALSYKLI